jgi:hypothetical protein
MQRSANLLHCTLPLAGETPAIGAAALVLRGRHCNAHGLFGRLRSAHYG